MQTEIIQFDRPLYFDFFFLKKEFISDYNTFVKNQKILNKEDYFLKFKGLHGEELISLLKEESDNLNKLFSTKINNNIIILKTEEGDYSRNQYNFDLILLNIFKNKEKNYLDLRIYYEEEIKPFLDHSFKIEYLDYDLSYNLGKENGWSGIRISRNERRNPRCSSHILEYIGRPDNQYTEFIHKTFNSHEYSCTESNCLSTLKERHDFSHQYAFLTNIDSILSENNFEDFYSFLKDYFKLPSNVEELRSENNLLSNTLLNNSISISLENICLFEYYSIFFIINFINNNGEESYIKLNYISKEEYWNLNINNNKYCLIGISNDTNFILSMEKSNYKTLKDTSLCNLQKIYTFDEIGTFLQKIKQKSDKFIKSDKQYDRTHLTHYEIFKNHDDLF